MAYNLEPRTIKENLLGLIGKNPHAEPRPANTREECFLADIAENGGGLPGVTSDDNGDVLAVVDGEWAKAPAPSSLPPYTSADKGKVLTVGEGGAEVVIPAQSLTIDSEGNGTLTGVDFSMLSDGDNVPTNMVIGGETTRTTGRYTSENSALVYDLPNTPLAVVIYSDGRVVSLVMAGASGAISASVPSVEPKWEGVHKVVEASATYTNGVTQLMTAAITEILTSGGTKTASYQYSNQIVTDEDAAAIENMIENWSTAPATLYAMGNYFTPAVVTNDAVQTIIPYYGYDANSITYYFSVKIVTNVTTKSVTMVVVLDYVNAGLA